MKMQEVSDHCLAVLNEANLVGLTSVEATERIDLGSYGMWKAPARLVINVERAYREFRNEPADGRWELPRFFDGIYHLATAKGIPLEF